ncbi:para-nitrobenzyl esterase-like [Rhipicephalus microplus]|uniref:para-nitrobenzyl esterase-like n=1 Tax=Rhipicephalus microplus TaxID=6941 RepID=UPI003F6BB3BB
MTAYPDDDPLAPMTLAPRHLLVGQREVYEQKPPQAAIAAGLGSQPFLKDATASALPSTTTVTAAADTTPSKQSTLAEGLTHERALISDERTESRLKRKVWVVKSTHGPIIGKVTDIRGKEVAEFRGIPYADRLDRRRRFEKPRPAMPWKRVLRAFRNGPSCYQPGPARDHPVFDAASQSENCLHVNTWIPLCAPSQPHCSQRTIVVYFHGGNLRRGSNSMPVYDGAVLSAVGQVIVAVPNYRLGVFGFLSHKVNGTHENLGLLDQVMALEWVVNNSEALGGSRDNIVVYGHDWGAYTASLFLVSPALQQRFRITRAILGSGSLLLPSRFASNDSHWQSFLQTLGCGARFFDDTLSCLRRARVEQLLVAQSRYPGSVGVVHPHLLLPRQPGQFLRLAHNFSRVQLLFTSTSLEGLGALDKVTSGVSDREATAGALSPEHLLARAGLHNGGHEFDESLALQRGSIRECYELAPNKTQYGSAFAVSFLGDVLFNCPLVLFARRMCQSGVQAFHVIVGQKPRFWNPTSSFQTGASHMDDLYFAFGVPISQRLNRDSRASAYEADILVREAAYSRRLIRFVTDFAKNGADAQYVKDFARPYCEGARSTEMFQGVHTVSAWRIQQCEVQNKYVRYI